MFSFFGWVVKGTIFAAIVLILGNTIHFGGRTVSDQIRSSLSHAEQTDAVDQVKTWANDAGAKAKKLISSTPKKQRHLARIEHNARIEKTTATERTPSESPRKTNHKLIEAETEQSESIPASERQELRTLIRSLNDSTEKLTAN